VNKTLLLISVENQVRELDDRLLLAGERTIDVFKKMSAELPNLPKPPLGDRL
jgi:hypothetical protein